MQRTMIRDTVAQVGESVLLKGWVHVRRDMGKLAFLDVRDRSGLAQVVLVPAELSERGKEAMKDLRPEFCVAITGVVQKRGEKQINPDMPTGTVEILAKDVEILNAAKTPPFELEDTSKVNEEVRLKYRYLDLRSARMLKNLELRDKVISFFRSYLHSRSFLEVETPNLTKGTPEGSREYLVPSRLHDGQFYVLPQSPQQFKQLLMVGGIEKYFQIARCFRDEDQRGDRQPEFTQLDMELSFVEREDVLSLIEDMMVEMVKVVAPEKTISQVPFPRISYAEAMEKHGSDKPDFRKDKNDPNELAFEWVVDFPMFEKDDEGGVQAVHHPFTSPLPEDAHLLESEPLNARANAYDLVLNGYEIFGGSIRIHKRELQNRVFQLLGLSDQTIQERFGHMLEAFEFGAPPHGGIASGLDRIVMILANEPNIREVIPFPKTGDARDLLMGAPSEIEEKRLQEAHIQVRKK
ncbi:aspartate--tRNA ligase [Patescibacteria group bacterium]|jgi:aspartyl-tRNA synthetase|nr:aspartate--tRNA ligase [Patescibacteria group bacterium]